MAIPFLPEFPQQNVEKSNRMDVDSFLILHDHFNEVEGAQQVVVERIRDVINKASIFYFFYLQLFKSFRIVGQIQGIKQSSSRIIYITRQIYSKRLQCLDPTISSIFRSNLFKNL